MGPETYTQREQEEEVSVCACMNVLVGKEKEDTKRAIVCVH